MLENKTAFPNISINFKNLDLIRLNMHGEAINTQSNFTNYNETFNKKSKYNPTKTLFIKSLESQKNIFQRKTRKNISNTVTEKSYTLNIPSAIKYEDRSLINNISNTMSFVKNRSSWKLIGDLKVSEKPIGKKVIDLDQYESIKSDLDNMRRSTYGQPIYQTALDNEGIIYFGDRNDCRLVKPETNGFGFSGRNFNKSGGLNFNANVLKQLESKENFYKSCERFYKPGGKKCEEFVQKTRLSKEIRELNKIKQQNLIFAEKFKYMRLRNVKNEIKKGVRVIENVNENIVEILNKLNADVVGEIDKKIKEIRNGEI
jgi:hypothetical protein